MPSESTFPFRYQAIAQLFQGTEKSVYLGQRYSANKDAIVAREDPAIIAADIVRKQRHITTLTRKICLVRARKEFDNQLRMSEAARNSSVDKAREFQVTIAALRKELTEPRQTCDSNANALNNARLATESAKGEQYRAEEEARRMHGARDRALQDLAAAQSEMFRSNRERDDARRDAKQVSEQQAETVAGCQAELDATNRDKEIAIEKWHDSDQAKGVLKGKLETLQFHKEQVDEHLAKAQETSAAMKIANEKAMSEIERLTSANSRLQIDHATALEQKRIGAEQQLERMKKEFNCAKIAQNDALQKYDSVVLLVQEAIRENDSLRGEQKEMEGARRDLERQLQNKAEECQQNAREHGIVLKKKEDENTNLINDLSVKRTELESAMVEIRGLNRELQAAQSTSANAKAEERRLKKDLADRDGELAAARQELTRSEKRAEELEQSSKSDRERIEALQSDVEAMNMEMNEQKAKSDIDTSKSAEQRHAISELNKRDSKKDADLRDLRHKQSDLKDNLLVEQMKGLEITSLGEVCEDRCDQKVQDDEARAGLTVKVSNLEQQAKELRKSVGRHQQDHLHTMAQLRHLKATSEQLAAALCIPVDEPELIFHEIEEMLIDFRLMKQELEACRDISNNRGSLIKLLEKIIGAMHQYKCDIDELVSTIPQRVLRFAEMVARQPTAHGRQQLLQEYAELKGLATPGKRKLEFTEGPSGAGRVRVNEDKTPDMQAESETAAQDVEGKDRPRGPQTREEETDDRVTGAHLQRLCLGQLPNIQGMLVKRR